MAQRRTRVVLSIPWDDEEHGHPAQWAYDLLLELEADDNGVGTLVIDFEDVNNQGEVEPV